MGGTESNGRYEMKKLISKLDSASKRAVETQEQRDINNAKRRARYKKQRVKKVKAKPVSLPLAVLDEIRKKAEQILNDNWVNLLIEKI